MLDEVLLDEVLLDESSEGETNPPDRALRSKPCQQRLSVILAVAACAVGTGARSFTAVAEWVAATSPGLLARVGVSDGPPSESTIRRTLQQLHGDGLDRLLGAWAQLREPATRGRRVIAIDGKSVRGSATPDRRCRHLLAVLDTDPGWCWDNSMWQ